MAQMAFCNEDDASVDDPTSSALALTGQVAQEHSLLPPVERIPTEILDTIFTIVHESSEYSLTLHEDTEFYSLSLPLSQVCSRWRRIAHSRPSLWASIFIDVGRVRRKTRHIVKLHLGKAGSHPLRIKLYVWPNVLRSTFGSDVLGMIIPELQRCEEFVFYGDWLVLAKTAHCDSSFAFPHLQALSMDVPSSAVVETMESVTPDFRWFSRALKNAPKLVTVVSPAFVDSEVLPFHQLTTVQYSNPLEVAQMARLLLSCPNLKNLEVSSLRVGFPPPDIVVHSSLRKLTIHPHPDWLVEIASPLAQFSLPALEMFTLKISSTDCLDTGLTSAVIATIQCFSASLRKLVLIVGSLNIGRTLFRDVLQICPNLYCFGFEVYAIRDTKDDSGSENGILRLIQDLTITDTSQASLAPKLVELCLFEYDSPMRAEYATAFLDMVESRSGGIGVARLTDAEFTYTSSKLVAQPELERIDSSVSDSSIAERIKKLSLKGIRCAIGAIGT
ncbi:hypothetical protein VNI00_018587 [Paramarasmius palmivorus]|uniref:F-box domain-containing protein n=1 Tax=Paramarasmius palmivorus TaxID=297713 RepID=A0AAW0AX05_9AGAR